MLNMQRPCLALGIQGVLATFALASESGTTWKQAQTFPAPEAKQAAAADERFVYAITNDVVAKYERQTGKRLATSTGDAEHLNSGFLSNGRLFCAHSNFPKKPEHSQVFVLDLNTMRLSSFKDFGNFGGSLTWAVRRGDHWWCNFALYGSQNSQTFLVKFDREWKELGRWTYPPEVVSEIGGASLSGGVWDGDTLLVTDHDHPVLYRLRVPQASGVLEFVETESAPITGQGIAYDPVTKGLVGIHRAQRRVVFLEREVTTE